MDASPHGSIGCRIRLLQICFGKQVRTHVRSCGRPSIAPQYGCLALPRAASMRGGRMMPSLTLTHSLSHTHSLIHTHCLFVCLPPPLRLSPSLSRDAVASWCSLSSLKAGDYAGGGTYFVDMHSTVCPEQGEVRSQAHEPVVLPCCCLCHCGCCCCCSGSVVAITLPLWCLGDVPAWWEEDRGQV